MKKKQNFSFLHHNTEKYIYLDKQARNLRISLIILYRTQIGNFKKNLKFLMKTKKRVSSS